MTTSRVFGPAARRRAHRRPRHRLVLRRQRHLLRARSSGSSCAWTARSSAPPRWSRRPRASSAPACATCGRSPSCACPLLLVTAVGTMAFNFSVILPLFATRDLDGSATTFTTLMSIMSLGSVVGALTIARRTEADTAFLARCTLALGVSMVALALAPSTAGGLPRRHPGRHHQHHGDLRLERRRAARHRPGHARPSARPARGGVPRAPPRSAAPSPAGSPRPSAPAGPSRSAPSPASAPALLTLRALHGSKGAEAAHLDTARIESAPLVAPGR